MIASPGRSAYAQPASTRAWIVVASSSQIARLVGAEDHGASRSRAAQRCLTVRVERAKGVRRRHGDYGADCANQGPFSHARFVLPIQTDYQHD